MDSVLPTPAPRHSALERLVAILNAGPESAAIRDALSSFADGKEEYPDDAVEAVGASAATMSEMFAMDDVDSVATKLNEILNATSSGPRLSNHGGARWHVHVDRQPFDWASWFLSASALSMAVALSDHGRVVWGRCARPGCGQVFSGLGRGTAQTYCSNRCGSRVRMAKQRALLASA